ncbi:MAG: UDP-N-acetylmuramate dehydrogenase [Peptoniphilaceae bacterium]|nr:UDP-N-acetylmuramate dehydrogenase [Peptoniphilaceae bacterium]MDY5842065.1 UDP-N-acetylmuramate dehydrogenase [Peptoniphilaceae bacterium]
MNTQQREELLRGAYGVVTEAVRFSEITTFHLGGPCDLMVEPTTEKELIRAVRFLREEHIPFYVVGNGSNLLVRDGGLPGVVIRLGKRYSDVIIDGTGIIAQAGALLNHVAKLSIRAGLTGMEDISGIPGTVGGGAIMNAGAYSGEMKQVVDYVRAIDTQGELRILRGEEMEMGYRTTRMMREKMVITEVHFTLQEGDPDTIWARYREVTEKRTTKQPLEKYSAGSVFKRPAGHFAGKLIQDAGLRGYSIGDAQVSEKHCGFIVNNGNATAKEVLGVISHVQKMVKERFGVDLEPEIRIIGVDTEESCKL